MFIGRNIDGTIYGCWQVRQTDDADHPRQEEVADNHPDLIAFLAPKAPPSQTELEAACIAGTSSAPAPRYGFDIQRAFIAHVISCEAYRLGVNPGALTTPQLTAIRARVSAIYKAL